MRRSHSVRWAAVVFFWVGANLVVPSARTGAARQQQAQSTFRSGVTAVPINVRVVDRDGRPVTDLKQGDFTVFEDDIRQPVVSFSQQVLVAQAPGPAQRARPEIPSFEPSPQSQRLFLIVLGAGSVRSRPLGPEGPSQVNPAKAIEGLLHLLRDRLLPQDQVALLAYNRATDFSADREGIARVLSGFQESEQAGLAALARQSAATSVQSPAASVFATAPAGPSLSTPAELGFAEYVNGRNRSTSDVETLYFGIKYLRFMPGEKHLIYLSANGLPQPVPTSFESFRTPPWDDPSQVAAAANNARVAVHVIQTGGIPSDPGPFLPAVPVLTPRIILPGQAYFGTGGSGSTSADGSQGTAEREPVKPDPWASVSLPGLNAVGMQGLQELRTLAIRTGGHASLFGDAAKALDRIDEETRVDYLLAYSPSNPTWDGRYRALRVEVNRPGVTVLFRHGYYAELPSASLTRRAVVADSRLIAAAASNAQRRDIAISAIPAFTKNTKGKGGEMVVRIVIDASRLGWTADDLERHVANLDVAVFCLDARGKTLGQTRRMLDVALTEARFELASKQGLPYTVRVPITAPARFVKIVVYNFATNLTGSNVFTLK